MRAGCRLRRPDERNAQRTGHNARQEQCALRPVHCALRVALCALCLAPAGGSFAGSVASPPARSRATPQETREHPEAALFEFDEVSDTLDARTATLSLQCGTYLTPIQEAGRDCLGAHTGMSAALGLRIGRDAVASFATFHGRFVPLTAGDPAVASDIVSAKVGYRMDKRTTATLAQTWGDARTTSVAVERSLSIGRADLGGWLWASTDTHDQPGRPPLVGFGANASYPLAGSVEGSFTISGSRGAVRHLGLQTSASLWGGSASLVLHDYAGTSPLAELRFWRALTATRGVGLYVTDRATAGLWTRWRH
jgi:hypothetical protein